MPRGGCPIPGAPAPPGTRHPVPQARAGLGTPTFVFFEPWRGSAGWRLLRAWGMSKRGVGKQGKCKAGGREAMDEVLGGEGGEGGRMGWEGKGIVAATKGGVDKKNER